MESVADTIGRILREAKFKTKICIGYLEKGVNDCITITDTGSGENDSKFAINESNVQVRIRADKYSEAYAKLYEVRKLLEGINGYKGENKFINTIYLSSSIALLERDENQKYHLTQNYRVSWDPNDANKGHRL